MSSLHKSKPQTKWNAQMGSLAPRAIKIAIAARHHYRQNRRHHYCQNHHHRLCRLCHHRRRHHATCLLEFVLVKI